MTQKLLILFLIGIVAGLAWKLYTAPAPQTQEARIAPPAPELKTEILHPVMVKPGKIQAYRPAVKARLKLPESILKDDAQVVVSSTRIRADDHPRTITAVTNTDTGQTTQYIKDEPLPWIQANFKTEVGIYAGIKSGQQAIRIAARQELLQIKSLHLGAIASADHLLSGPTDTFIGLGIWARW